MSRIKGLAVTKKLGYENQDYDVRVTFRGKLLTTVRLSYIIHKQMADQTFWPTFVHEATEAEGLGFTYDEVDQFLRKANYDQN